jgi:putative component of toxin-antitoxin plasmid stabilization module
MPTTNARKHKIPAGGEQTVNRKTIFEDWGNSIRDIVPVATINERTQVLNALAAAGEGPSAARPLVVLRADARGMHRIEYTTDGAVWVPASGVMGFASLTAATSFATSSGGYLAAGDRCRISGTEWRWTGAKWVPAGNGLLAAAQVLPQNLILTTAVTEVAGLSLAGCPTGVPAILDITVDAINGGSGAQRFIDVQAYNGATALDTLRRFSLPLQVNTGNAYTINYAVYLTPASDTFTLRLGVDQNASVVLRQAELRLTLRP